MRTTTTIARLLVRITGILLLLLGILFWTGHALSLIQLHMGLGLILVLSLWALAIVGGLAGAGAGLVALAAVWGFILPALGIGQLRLLPGAAHWVIQVLHLLVGIAAMAIGDRLGRRIDARLPAPALASERASSAL